MWKSFVSYVSSGVEILLLWSLQIAWMRIQSVGKGLGAVDKHLQTERLCGVVGGWCELCPPEGVYGLYPSTESGDNVLGALTGLSKSGGGCNSPSPGVQNRCG